MTVEVPQLTKDEAKELVRKHAWVESVDESDEIARLNEVIAKALEYLSDKLEPSVEMACDVLSKPPPPGRTLIHSQGGLFGADWDLHSALDAIDKAQMVGWTYSIFGHDLGVQLEDGRVMTFDVPAPPDVKELVLAHLREARAAEASTPS